MKKEIQTILGWALDRKLLINKSIPDLYSLYCRYTKDISLYTDSYIQLYKYTILTKLNH